MITVDALEKLASVRHGFFTRAGGVSGAVYASLNVGYGSGDDPANVAANRARAMARMDLPPEALVTAYQVHGVRVAAVEQAWPPGAAPTADGLVTRKPGAALGIVSADCAPVLFADAGAGVIGATHAGWRGALAGVLEATVEAMVRLGADPANTIAAVGPCIGRESYEVGPEFAARFIAEDPDNARFFGEAARGERCRFDFAGYVASRLDALGLGLIVATMHDTCLEDDRFFSYRRSVLCGDKDYGRGLSAIALAP